MKTASKSSNYEISKIKEIHYKIQSQYANSVTLGCWLTDYIEH